MSNSENKINGKVKNNQSNYLLERIIELKNKTAVKTNNNNNYPLKNIIDLGNKTTVKITRAQIILIHNEALLRVKTYLANEVKILNILKEVEVHKVYFHYNCKSLYVYATKKLGLSEAVAYAFIQVMRTINKVPELQDEIKKGNLSIHKAKKICSVLNPQKKETKAIIENNFLKTQGLINYDLDTGKVATAEVIKTDNKINISYTLTKKDRSKFNILWIKKAKQLSSKDLEKEVAEVSPEIKKSSINSCGNGNYRVHIELNKVQEQKLTRVKVLLSKKLRKTARLDEVLEKALDVFLEKNDPLKKAERILGRKALLLKTLKTKAFNPKIANNKFVDLNNKTTNNHNLRASKKSTSTPNQRKVISAKVKHQLYLKTKGRCQADIGFKKNGQLLSNKSQELLKGNLKTANINKQSLNNKSQELLHSNLKTAKTTKPIKPQTPKHTCLSTNFLEIHHKTPLSKGGGNNIENLTLLCSAHHKQLHFGE